MNMNYLSRLIYIMYDFCMYRMLNRCNRLFFIVSFATKELPLL